MATIIKPFFNPNTSSDPYSNDFSDSELCDEFDSMGVHPNSTTSMHPRPSASKATLWRKRQPRSLPKTGNVLVNEALSRRVNLNPAISLPSYYDIEPDFKETRVFSQAPPAAAAPHTYEEVESSFASSTGSLFQSVYDNWQNEEARSGAVPEIDGRHTTASSRTSSSIFELYQQDSSRNPISGMNIESRLLDKNFHPDSALRGQTNGMSTELTRGEGLPPPLPTRSLVKHQGRERLHERGQTSFDVVEEEDEEYSNYKYNNEDDGLNDNYNRKNSGDTSSAVPASVHPFSFQQLPLLSGMPFPIHSNFSSPHHVNTSPFLNEDKRSQILEWNQKHDYTTSPPQSRDPSPTRAISRTPVAARALPEYSGPTSTDSDQVDSPRSSFGPHRAREMSYDSTSTVHAGLALHILERRRNSQAEALLARRASRPILRDEDRFVIMGVESDDPDKVSGESEADAIDEIPEAQAEKVAPRKDEQNVTPVSVPTLVTPATEDDNGSICVIRDASVGLVDGDDESTPGDRVVVFRIKDGNVKQTSSRSSKTPKKSRSASRSPKTSKVPKMPSDQPLASSAVSSPKASISIPPHTVEKTANVLSPETPLDSESHLVPLRDNEDVSVNGDGRRGSRLMDGEFLDLLNRYEVLKCEMSEMKQTVFDLSRWHRAEVERKVVKFQALARGHMVRMDPRFREFRRCKNAAIASQMAVPVPWEPTFASRYMSASQLWLQCARVGRTNSSSLATANPGAFFVTNFQAHARGFIIRKMVDTYWLHCIAASRIQAAWRGYKTRNFVAPKLSLHILRRIQRRAQALDGTRVLQLEQRMEEEAVWHDGLEGRLNEVVDEVRLLRQLEDRVQEEVDLRKGYEKKIENTAAEIKQLRHLEQRVREESELRKGLQSRLEEAQADMLTSRTLKQRVLEEAELRRALEKRLDEAVEEMQVSRQLKQRMAEEAELRKGLERKLQEALEDITASKELEQRVQEEAESRRKLEQRLEQALVEMRAAKELEQRVAAEEKHRKVLEKKLEEAFAEIRALKTTTATSTTRSPPLNKSTTSSMRASVGPAHTTATPPTRATRTPHVPSSTADRTSTPATRAIGRTEEKRAVLGRVNSPINKPPLLRN